MGTAAIIGAVVAIIAAATSAYAQYEQAQTQQAIGKFNKRAAENAALAQRQAAMIEAQNLRERQAAILASQRANIGASGVIASEGTPLLVQTDSAEKAALNEARTRYAGEVGAKQYESEAIIQGYTAQRAARAGYIGAGASLLQGVGAAAGGYAQYRRGSTTSS